MDILKEAQASEAVTLTQEDLALIHAQSRKELTAEEVYTFSVRLCDNQVDRDFDRFPRETLEELAPLFVGKSGIFDHSWTAKGQACRIYKTEVVEENPADENGYGEGSYFLKGYVYMIRTASNDDLIAEIEAGIKKEVSVGCSVKDSICSVCGEAIESCSHQKGETYEAGLCYSELIGATDAYEFSFVAVPAQQKAGVMKGMGLENHRPEDALKGMDLLGTLTSMLQGSDHQLQKQEEYLQLKGQLALLQEQARMGRQCLVDLQKEVTRLGCLSHQGLSQKTMEAVAEKLNGEELTALKEAFSQQVAEKLPLQTQLHYGAESQGESDKAFLI